MGGIGRTDRSWLCKYSECIGTDVPRRFSDDVFLLGIDVGVVRQPFSVQVDWLVFVDTILSEIFGIVVWRKMSCVCFVCRNAISIDLSI